MTAQIEEMTPEKMADWQTWLAERPAHIRALAERLPPWNLYLLKSSGHRVEITAYSEGPNGSVSLKVAVTGAYNFVAFEREVFGIDPNDLEPCDLPPPDEIIGSCDVDIETVRAKMREGKGWKDSDAAEWYIEKHGRDAFEAKFVAPTCGRILPAVGKDVDVRQVIRDVFEKAFGSPLTDDEVTRIQRIGAYGASEPENKS